MANTKTLYLLRHAKAETGTATQDDHDRGLNQQGLEACQIMGQYIAGRAMVPQLVLCSTAKRAKTTWSLVREASRNTSKQEFSDMLYLASANEVIKQLMCLPEDVSSVMVVGHNPGLHQLSLTLSKRGDDALMLLAAEVTLEEATQLANDVWRCRHMTKEIKARIIGLAKRILGSVTSGTWRIFDLAEQRFR